MPVSTAVPAADWTCDRCEVTVSWMADAERPELPGTWTREGEVLYCLGCRRERAGEAALVGLEEASGELRHRAETRGRVDFEMRRRPETQDSRIAKSCHTSVKIVRDARVRLGMQSRLPAA